MPDVTPPGGGVDQSDILSDGTPFAGSDVGETLSEIQSGRTRELLLLLQDKPVPEVQDPMNIQSGLSENPTLEDGDYIMGFIPTNQGLIDDFEFDGEDTSVITVNNNWSDWTGNIDKLTDNGNVSNGTVAELQADGTSNSVTTTAPAKTTENVSFDIGFEGSLQGEAKVKVTDSDSGLVCDVEFEGFSTNKVSLGLSEYTGTSYETSFSKDAFANYEIRFVNSFEEVQLLRNGSEILSRSIVTDVNSYDRITFDLNTGGSQAFDDMYFDNLYAGTFTAALSSQITDRFSAPTTTPADFKAWNAIRAEDVTTGGSTSPEPVEFEILDSTDTALNSTRIPKERIAGEPFTMRNRVYNESAASNGQSDYQITTTGDGGHFGIPILTIVNVKKNGSVLDSANWSFDGDTTVTIDTSSVTIVNGDTIDIKYDFDVFDSTLQPRAYLSREDTSETSPSISHFRYEYVI